MQRINSWNPYPVRVGPACPQRYYGHSLSLPFFRLGLARVARPASDQWAGAFLRWQ